MRLRNVKKQQSLILERCRQLANAAEISPACQADLASYLAMLVASIERLCAEGGSAPTELPGPSRRAYAWFKFLTLEDHLARHLEATRTAQQLATERLAASDRPETSITVHFTDYTGLYKYSSDRQSLEVEFSEGFIVADRELLGAALEAIVARQTRLNSDRLRAFSCSEDYGRILQTLARLGSDAERAASGDHYDLNALFAELNRQYFHDQLAPPQLVWSQRRTRRKLGHYESSRDRIVLSRSLDSPRVPAYVVAYVLYHELLHKHCGIHWQNGRQRAHTREFRAAEQQFQQYDAAIAWLEQHSL